MILSHPGHGYLIRKGFPIATRPFHSRGVARVLRKELKVKLQLKNRFQSVTMTLVLH